MNKKITLKESGVLVAHPRMGSDLPSSHQNSGFFDIERFCSDFQSKTLVHLIRYIISEKSVPLDNLIAYGLLKKHEYNATRKQPGHVMSKIKYLAKIGFIHLTSDTVRLNEHFIPINQRNGQKA